MLNFTETAFYLALYLWSNNLIVHTLVFFWNDDDFVIEHSILQKTPYISAGVCVCEHPRCILGGVQQVKCNDMYKDCKPRLLKAQGSNFQPPK